MANFRYSPDADLKVHERGAIRLLCLPFQSHESGLPEWLKNAADAYARCDAPEGQRVIVVIFDDARPGAAPSISCLDFCGMTSENIERHFRVWADPDAARRGSKARAIQGGHGNGGKCYMAQMFDDHAVIHTVKEGLGNHYGVKGGSFRFGFIPSRRQGRDFAVASPREDLGNALATLGCTLSSLPPAAHQAIGLGAGFTLISGVAPKGFRKKIPVRQLTATLEQHPQMILTLALCRVYIVANGRVQNHGQPLSLPQIAPIDGGEAPHEVLIPLVLLDPVSNERVSTTDGGRFPQGRLVLSTSRSSMRWRKVRHNITFAALSGYIGYIPVTELEVQSPYRNHIYGSCHLDALETSKQNERARLATSPLTRAIESFISGQVEQYARAFEAGDLRRYDQQEKSALMRMNEALDQWKNRCLNVIRDTRWRETRTAFGGGGARLPSGTIERLEISLHNRRAGIGVSFQPLLRCYDPDGWQIKKPPVQWTSTNPRVATIDDSGRVRTHAEGRTTLYAQRTDGTHKSNRVQLRVVTIDDLQVVPDALEIAPGARYQLDAICRLSTGEQISHVTLGWHQLDEAIAKVSPHGIVYGFAPGETAVVVGDGRSVAKPCLVRVLSSSDKRNAEIPGQGYPVVLISGEIDADPVSRSFVNFGADDPPVCQRVEDVERNVWWINSAAPLAQLYLDATRGYGYHSREWRIYHLERYIEIIVQILLTQEMNGELCTVDDWMIKWGSQVAEIQSIAASDLDGFIATGELPAEMP